MTSEKHIYVRGTLWNGEEERLDLGVFLIAAMILGGELRVSGAAAESTVAAQVHLAGMLSLLRYPLDDVIQAVNQMVAAVIELEDDCNCEDLTTEEIEMQLRDFWGRNKPS